jgi:hypothetical protein
VRETKNHAALPIGRTARTAYDLDALRAACCKAARMIVNRSEYAAAELEECAALDDALAHAQRVLKNAVRTVMLSRLSRNTRAR